MKIIYISPEGVISPMLFDTFKQTFAKNGIEETKNFYDADICFMDLYSNLKPFDDTVGSILKSNNIPLVMFDATDYGGMSKERFDEKHYNWHNCKKIVFIRKMDKTVKYPEYIYPYELIMYPDHVFEPVSKEELFNRPVDICFIGNISPTRLNVTNGLKDNFICDFVLGEERIPHNDWLNRAMDAKMFLTSDGGGFGDERPYQLMYISPMVRQRNDQLIIHNFRDGLECIEVSENPTTQEIKILKDVLSDADMLYDIYLAGIKRMEKYFNADYRTNYILEILKKNEVCL